MDSPPARSGNAGSTIVAQLAAAAARGALDSARLANLRLALVVVPLFAVTGPRDRTAPPFGGAARRE